MNKILESASVSSVGSSHEMRKPVPVLLVAVQLQHHSEQDIRESLAELGELVRTAGGVVCEQVIQRRQSLDRSNYLGTGKMREIGELARRLECVQIVADDELSALQTRRMEDGIGIPVIDRTTVILDIFAGQASTREGQLQVELAQLQYRLLRLTGGYLGLSRQRGGIGTKGPGETQLETDRRVMKDRIDKLHEELRHVACNRELQGKKRTEQFAPLFAMVGYTNAGKSTLLNALSGSDVTVRNALFTTLDPTARRLELPGGRVAILSDTVGFIRKLPHGLVEAFRATLESVISAHIIVFVADLSDSRVRQQIEAVEEVLAELSLQGRERVMVFNKTDAAPPGVYELMKAAYPEAVFVSALSGAGLDSLRTTFAAIVGRQFKRMNVCLPTTHPLLKTLLSLGKPHAQEWQEDTVALCLDVPLLLQPKLQPFLVD